MKVNRKTGERFAYTPTDLVGWELQDDIMIDNQYRGMVTVTAIRKSTNEAHRIHCAESALPGWALERLNKG